MQKVNIFKHDCFVFFDIIYFFLNASSTPNISFGHPLPSSGKVISVMFLLENQKKKGRKAIKENLKERKKKRKKKGTYTLPLFKEMM